MNSFDVMKDYMKREMNSSELDKTSREARRIVGKVKAASGNDLREKAKNAGISYEDFMKAQRYISKKVS